MKIIVSINHKFMKMDSIFILISKILKKNIHYQGFTNPYFSIYIKTVLMFFSFFKGKNIPEETPLTTTKEAS